MKLIIKWRYPNEDKIHEHTFYDINPAKINISYGFLYFEEYQNAEERHWQYPINHVIKMQMEEEI